MMTWFPLSISLCHRLTPCADRTRFVGSLRCPHFSLISNEVELITSKWTWSLWYLCYRLAGKSVSTMTWLKTIKEQQVDQDDLRY